MYLNSANVTPAHPLDVEGGHKRGKVYVQAVPYNYRQYYLNAMHGIGYCRELQLNQPRYGMKEQSDYAGRLQQLPRAPWYDIKSRDYDEVIKKGNNYYSHP